MEQTLGPYKIVREIGKGGMGIIYKALNPADQKTVAIKVLPPTMVDRVTVERFHREAKAMAKLRHPNMVEVFESGMEHGKHFLVMEFIEGENLKSIIKARGTLPVSECARISIQVAEALSHLHQSGMIHRDIKPSNIMVTPEGKVKLMDYGLVKIMGLTSVTVEGAALGTVEYMSPEQITGEGVDIRADIYSLGITVYEMATGQLPFKGQTPQELLLKHQSEVPVSVRSLRPQIPPELEKIINRAIAKQPQQRYPCAEALGLDLIKLNPVPSPASPSRTTEKDTPVFDKKLLPPVPSNQGGIPWGIIFFVLVLSAPAIIFRDPIMDFLHRLPVKQPFHLTQSKDLIQETNKSLNDLEEADRHFSAGEKYLRQGEVDEAIGEFEQAAGFRKDDPVIFRSLAQAYEKKNDYKNAVAAWRNLLKYETDITEIKNAQKHLKELEILLK